MRVGVVCPYSLSEPGGVQDQVTGLARALADLGHVVEIIAPGDVSTELGGTSAGLAFRFRVNGSIAPMAPHPAAAVRTVRALRRGRFDVLHLHEPLAPSITIPALLAHPAPVVGTFHAAGDRTPYRWLGASLSRLANRIDARVAVSEPAAVLARHHLGGACDVLFNGIDVERFRGAPHARVDGPTILFLGRHEPRKGLDVLLGALPLLPLDITVWIAGDGRDTSRLRDQHRGDSRVRWLGRLPEADKIGRLGAASVLCAPSRHGESFGMVLLEAMAARTPVVASDVPGYRALSDHGRAAHLVPPGDKNALADGLLRVLSDGRLADDLREHGDCLVRRCSMHELARRYVAIYERVTR
ncbi:MAG: glycosyltransferase family 4 protein [Acidimicrobiia bacterium]